MNEFIKQHQTFIIQIITGLIIPCITFLLLVVLERITKKTKKPFWVFIATLIENWKTTLVIIILFGLWLCFLPEKFDINWETLLYFTVSVLIFCVNLCLIHYYVIIDYRKKKKEWFPLTDNVRKYETEAPKDTIKTIIIKFLFLSLIISALYFGINSLFSLSHIQSYETEEFSSRESTSSSQKESYATTQGTTDLSFVDLGLSVLWADRNIGATSPTDCGYHFAWGESSHKSYYSAENYHFAGSNSAAFFYNGLRTPTVREWNELLYDCYWQWTSFNGRKGYQVTGPNGNSIFLPANGYAKNGSVVDSGKRGYYWSCNAGKASDCARQLGFGANDYGMHDGHVYYGQGIRAVK